MLAEWIGWLLPVWGFIMIAFMAIGGFFMFRKFLKALPRADGKSKLDWQNYYVEQSRHLWTEQSRAMLDLLVKPVPAPFRDTAKHSIAAKIGEIALKENAQEITEEHCIRGYILATPRRDHKWLKAYLDKKGVDYSQYRHLLDI